MISDSEVRKIVSRAFLEVWDSNTDSLFIDARSDGEIKAGALPHFQSLPILSDESRHRVGLAYKQQGQEEAIELGMALEGPNKSQLQSRIQKLIQESKPKTIYVTCWRGGLRSRLMSQIIQEVTDIPVFQIEGGYKALRNHLLSVLEDLPELLVLSGPTGSMKTELLNESFLKTSVDLEAMAHHRGSSFGYHFSEPQPSQSTFENKLFWRLRHLKGKVAIIEDESRLIGRLVIPDALKNKMRISKVVFLKQSLEERVKYIYKLYVSDPLKEGRTPESVVAFYLERLAGLKKRLGGVRYKKLESQISEAFLSDMPEDFERHATYLRDLLVNYYDKTYLHSFEQSHRKIVFEGNQKECREWLMKRFDFHRQLKKGDAPLNSLLEN